MSSNNDGVDTPFAPQKAPRSSSRLVASPKREGSKKDFLVVDFKPTPLDQKNELKPCDAISEDEKGGVSSCVSKSLSDS